MRYINKLWLISIVVLFSSIASAGVITPPSNDYCDSSVVISSYPYSNMGSTNSSSDDSPLSQCGENIDGPGVWYLVEGTGHMLTATTCNTSSGYDTKLHVFCANCDYPVCIGGNYDTGGGGCYNLTSQVSWCSRQGDYYLIFISGYNGTTGDFQLDVTEGSTCEDSPSCPNHDMYDNEVSIDFSPGKTPKELRSCKSTTNLNVSILGSLGFDFTSDIDISTLKFGKAGASPIKNTFRDFNHDGYTDLKSSYSCPSSGIESGDILVCVSGGSAPSSNNCCSEHPETTGCNGDASCQNLVCTGDSYCCTDEWDAQCADEASRSCAVCIPDNDFYGCKTINVTY